MKDINTTPTTKQTLLFLGTEEDKSYGYNLKSMTGTATVFAIWQEVATVAEVIAYCKKRGITGVLCTQVGILDRLVTQLGKSTKKKPSIDNYQGSYFLKDGIEFVFLAPLKQIQTVSYGSFIARRFVSKLVAPEQWNSVPQFTWSLLTGQNYERVFADFSSAVAIAVDIETTQEQLAIRCIGYTALWIDASGNFRTQSVVLPIDSMFAVSIMRKFNYELQAPKVLQNGKYDCAYLARYNAVLYNYLWDTANMFHSWYSELPKDLGFLTSFFVRKSMYWKDLSDTDDVMEYYRYNALDTYGTLLVFICWILEAPAWAKDNYSREFPLAFPCHLCEMTGIKRDMEALGIARAEIDTEIEETDKQLSTMLGTWPTVFNINSTPQNSRLRTVLGCADLTSSDETHLKKIANRHPLNAVIVAKILSLRGAKKLKSTYLRTDADADKNGEGGGKEYKYRILTSLNPHGTDTCRLASKESPFWCGLNFQNIPRGPIIKQTIIADDDFLLAEDDLAQAESRDTAYVSGDEAYIAAVSGEDDFHSRNASAFFGVPYEEIYDNATKKTINKPLRQLAKPVNHGANYLMGWAVLIDSMGETEVWNAKRLLKLPRHYGLKETAQYLLAQFHKTYPTLEASYYPAVVHEVVSTRMLVTRAYIREPVVYNTECIYNDTGTEPNNGVTRYCFGDPAKNKRDKNSYVAHVSQSLNAQSLNIAFLVVFYEIAINPKYAPNFKLMAQIHDSILHQFRNGHRYLSDMVKDRMEIPIRIQSYDGKTRTFTVPADVKAGKDNLGAKRWSETE